MLFVKSKELLLRGEGGLARAAGGCSAPSVRMSLSNSLVVGVVMM